MSKSVRVEGQGRDPLRALNAVIDGERFRALEHVRVGWRDKQKVQRLPGHTFRLLAPFCPRDPGLVVARSDVHVV